MTLLLDSHIVAWMTTDSRHISAVAASALRKSGRSAEGIAIASSTLWEIAMMAQRGEMRVPGTLESFLRGLESVFVVLPISAQIAAKSVQFSSSFPKDPTDRIIAATAIVHGLHLVTHDAGIRRSGEVNCIW